ncbi:hypothetical protein Trydic_g3423 [Trypoxylus dichotomus]
MCSHSVPKMLTDFHKTKRLSSALAFLVWYSVERDKFLNGIETSDETWSCAMCSGADRAFWFEFLSRGETNNAERYCGISSSLRRAIQEKRLLHDNARPRPAGVTQNRIEQFGLNQLDQPSYSPNITPSDYHLLFNL